MDRKTLQNIALVLLLVGLGVGGRLMRPEWNFTPMTAIAVFAGFYFRSWAAILLVPLAARVISDYYLPPIESKTVLIAVYSMTLLAVLSGNLLKKPLASRLATLARGAMLSLLPALLFFFVTNFAVWLAQSDATISSGYENNLSGLIACLVAGIPFFRTMLCGDLFYLSVLFSVYALVQIPNNARTLSASS